MSIRSAVAYGAVSAAVLDLIFAYLYYGFYLAITQTIAGGILGRDAARSGGIATAILGAALHFVIMFGWAGAYALLSRRAHWLRRWWFPCGLLYGFVIYVGMRVVILPLSALHTSPWPIKWELLHIAGHMVLVGLPIAWFASRIKS